jgi:hypothetical protein
MIKHFFSLHFYWTIIHSFQETKPNYGEFMTVESIKANIGPMTTSTAIGAGLGGVTGFVTSGPAGVVPGMKLGGTIGAQFAGVAKLERGLDSAGRKVEQIATDTSTKIGQSIEKSSSELSAKVGQNVDALGLAAAKVAITATDKLCEASAKTLETIVSNLSGVAIGGYAAQTFYYISREGSDVYFKHCRETKDFNCTMITVTNLGMNVALLATVSVIFTHVFNELKKKK